MSMLKCLVTHNTKTGPYALVLLRNMSGSSFTHAYATVFKIKIFPRDAKPPGDHIKTIASSYMENILTAPVWTGTKQVVLSYFIVLIRIKHRPGAGDFRRAGMLGLPQGRCHGNGLRCPEVRCKTALDTKQCAEILLEITFNVPSGRLRVIILCYESVLLFWHVGSLHHFNWIVTADHQRNSEITDTIFC